VRSNYVDFGEIVQFIFTTGKNVSELTLIFIAKPLQQ